MPIWPAYYKQSKWTGYYNVYAKMSGRDIWIACFISDWMADEFIKEVYNKRA